jgi:hypothetical protein
MAVFLKSTPSLGLVIVHLDISRGFCCNTLHFYTLNTTDTLFETLVTEIPDRIFIPDRTFISALYICSLSFQTYEHCVCFPPLLIACACFCKKELENERLERSRRPMGLRARAT